MRILIFGNSGSGKTTLARSLAARHELTHLDLDNIVWERGETATQRSAEATASALQEFLDAHSSWIIEGCYGELIESASCHCTELIFLNPGLDTCLHRNRQREWEPHKYVSKQAQDDMLANLQSWVVGYYERQDSWSYHAHRRIYDAFQGSKHELVNTEIECGLPGMATS